MKCRLYMRLSNGEKRTLQYTVGLLNASSFRSAILSLCDFSLTERLCLISLIEVQFRKINVNLHQISKWLSAVGEKDEVILSACEMLDSLIDLFSRELSCLRFSDSDADSERKELAVRMSPEEKDVVVSVKRALKFRNFRTLVLSLCGIVNNQILPPDFSHEYQVLREHGSNINTVAKALNSGTAINVEQFNKYLTGFMLFLCDVARKAEGI